MTWYNTHKFSDQEVQQLRARIAQLEAEAAAGRQAQQQLRFVQARRQSHLNNTPLAAIFWNTDLCVQEWNPAAERIFGYSSEEALGANVLELVVRR